MSLKGLRKGITVLIFFVVIFFNALSNSYGSGFAVYTHSASALGQANAVTAHANDPTAIFYNPALINKLEGIQIELGTTLFFPSRKFKSDLTGKSFDGETDLVYPSTLFISNKLSEKLSAGVGVFNPFGLKNKWPDDWEGKYITTNSELQTFNINPVISYQIRPWITFAAGFDYMLLDATLEKNIPSFFGDIEQKFEGDGDGIGYNFGILIEPYKDISIGASYRSEIEVDIDGDANFDLPNSSLSPFFPDTNGDTEITLPQQVLVGIYYKGFYPLTFEVGLRWEGWSSFERLKIDLDRPVGPPPGTTTSITQRKWDDTYSGNIGVKYQLDDSIALHAGYLYSGNPVPDETFDPTIPDADTHIYCIGTDIKYKSFRFALAYSFQKLQNRNKDNDVDDDPSNPRNPATAANGEYKTNFHMVGASLTYTF